MNNEAAQMINQIVEKIKKEYSPEKIILFGSYATGHAHRDSDIDLLIIKDTAERPIDRRVAVVRMASDPNRLIPFEPLVLTPQELESRLKINDHFVREIIETGEVLYAA
jgi:uncharacterized protein